MHPFPLAEDLQFLIGSQVEVISLGPWTTQVSLADGGRIAMEGPFEHIDPAGGSRTCTKRARGRTSDQSSFVSSFSSASRRSSARTVG